MSSADLPNAQPTLLAGVIAILNACFSAVDILNTLLILHGVPAGAIIRNNGWPSYWRFERP